MREDVSVRGLVLGTAATRQRRLCLFAISSMTVDTVPSQLDRRTGRERSRHGAEERSGHVRLHDVRRMSHYAFRGFLDAVEMVDGVRNEGNRVNTAAHERRSRRSVEGAVVGVTAAAALGATVNIIRKKPSEVPSYDFSATRGKLGNVARRLRRRWAARPAGDIRLDVGGESAEGYRHDDSARVTSDTFAGLAPGQCDSAQRELHVQSRSIWPVTRAAAGRRRPRRTGFRQCAESAARSQLPHSQDDATSVDHNLQVVFARQLTGSWGIRNTLSYRHFDDEYFLSEGVTFEPPSTILRDYLYFKHHRRPLTNLAEITGTVHKGIEQNLLVGWEGQRYPQLHDAARERFLLRRADRCIRSR